MSSPRKLFLFSLAIFTVSFFFPLVKMYDDTGIELLWKTFTNARTAQIQSLDEALYFLLVFAPNFTVLLAGAALFGGCPRTAIAAAATGYLICLNWSYAGFFLGIRIGHVLWHIGEFGVLVSTIWNFTKRGSSQ
jgi:hypothetical protein